MTNPLGQGSAPFNPRSQLLPVSPSSSVSIPNGTFRGGKTSRTCILSLQVSVPYRVNNKSTKKRGKKKNAGEPLSDAAEDENGMPLHKRMLVTHLDAGLDTHVHGLILRQSLYLRRRRHSHPRRAPHKTTSCGAELSRGGVGRW